MKKQIALFVAVLPLSACISFRQEQLPPNHAITYNYPRAVGCDQNAALALADNYRQGFGGVLKNDAESLRLWIDKAEAGNIRAQQALADYYKVTDRERASYWYLRMAESGNKFALGNLAILNGDSKYGAPDHQTALKWAYTAENNYLINQYQKMLSPEAQEQARQQAEEWKRLRLDKDGK